MNLLTYLHTYTRQEIKPECFSWWLKLNTAVWNVFFLCYCLLKSLWERSPGRFTGPCCSYNNWCEVSKWLSPDVSFTIFSGSSTFCHFCINSYGNISLVILITSVWNAFSFVSSLSYLCQRWMQYPTWGYCIHLSHYFPHEIKGRKRSVASLQLKTKFYRNTYK